MVALMKRTAKISLYVVLGLLVLVGLLTISIALLSRFLPNYIQIA